MTNLTTMPIEELQALLNGLLVDSWTASRWLNLKPATLRDPRSRYYKYSIKIGQYRYWRRKDLRRMALERIEQITGKRAGYVDGTDGVKDAFIDITVKRGIDSDESNAAAEAEAGDIVRKLTEAGFTADAHLQTGLGPADMIVTVINHTAG